MVNEKIVIVLLLVTIILSVFSVVVALGAGDLTKIVREKEVVTGDSEVSGNVQLYVRTPTSGGAE